MHSIRAKIMILIISITIVVTLFFGGSNLYDVHSYETRLASRELKSICLSKKDELNTILDRTKGFVDMAESYVVTFVKDPKDIQNASIRKDLNQTLSSMMCKTVMKSKDIETFYLHFNEETIKKADGFWYIKDQKKYVAQKELTVATDYKKDQTKWNGWYYQPLEAHKAIWMQPYYNANLGLNILSYVVPIYVKGQFIGVIGADLSFSTLYSSIEKIKIYKQGHALLTNDDYETITENVTIGSNKELSIHKIKKIKNTSIHDCQYNGIDSKMCEAPLMNGLRLVVVVSKAEVFAKRNQDLKILLCFIMSTFVVVIILIMIFTHKMTQPLIELTSAAYRISQGDYHVDLKKTTKDEIGTLTDAFNLAMKQVNHNVTSISNKAYTDELTKVKNYNAYELEVNALNDEIESGTACFMILMIDVNGLKAINDTYGHKKGSEILVKTTKIICDACKHSPVFRIGGDEFVAILKRSDYDHYKEILEELRPYIVKRDMNGDEPYKQVAFSMGLAKYDEKMDHCYNDVFTRADDAMYKCKKRIKAERED